ncbi:hypothetical protein F4803DRAFT_536371 [Xylaria telfairii]|nr:hypothetical protein F4803DRAFT_536371 [Xylaria telfairii]
MLVNSHYYAKYCLNALMASTTLSDNSSQKAICHCGRIAMTLPNPPKDISECHCSLCYKLGALWAYYPRDEVAVTTSSPAFTTLTSPASFPSQLRPIDITPITRGINTAVDEALDSYVSMDMPSDKENATFYRCAHCGALTHRWGVSKRQGDDVDESIMGVNCRLLPENEISKTKRITETCRGLDVKKE